MSACQKPPFPDPRIRVSVKDFGAKGDGVADETKAFKDAQVYAKSNNGVLYIPNGIYKVDLELLYDSLDVVGEKMPLLKDNALTDGAVIKGSINAKNRKHIEVSNLGVWSTIDAIVTGDGLGSAPLYQKYSNINLLGTGYSAFKHGFLCQSGSTIELSNIIVNRFFHGIALRCSNVAVSKVEANNCGFTSIVVKSATGGNNLAENVFINDVKINGSSSDIFSMGGVVMVQSFDDDCITRNVRIDNVTSSFGGVGAILVQQYKGKLENISVLNVKAYNIGDSRARAAFSVEGGASNVSFSNCLSANAKGIGYYSDSLSSNVRVINSFESNSGVAAWKGKFRFLELNNQVLIR